MTAHLTVSQLTEQLKRCVDQNFSRVQVVGEIVGLVCHRSGHWYFSLREDTVVLDAVCWRSVAVHLHKPQEGMQVVCEGSLALYRDRSKYQMIVRKLSLHGEGQWLKILEERKKKLQHLFLAPKKPFPPIPKTIGVITSPTGAVIQDILHRLRERFPCNVLLWPVTVQGETCAAEVEEALTRFPQVIAGLDMIILARGGGSFMDLLPFSEEAVVRAIAQCPVPVMSAIGHETDVTLADFVADERAPTPTAAAEKSVPHKRDVQSHITALGQRLYRAWCQKMQHMTHPVSLFHQRLMRTLEQNWWTAQQRCDDVGHRFYQRGQHVHQTQALRWAACNIPSPAVDVFRQKLNQTWQTFQWHLTRGQRQEAVRTLSHRLEVLSPEQQFRRGWLYLHHKDRVIAPETLTPHQKITLRFQGGHAEAWVLSVQRSQAGARKV